MRLSLKNIFLFDGIGALLSAILTGLILPNFSEQLGLSRSILYGLAVLPIFFCAYSIFVYTAIKEITKKNLVLIILANFLYCLISGTLILALDSITLIGRVILSAEIIVVLVVISVEYYVYSRSGLKK